MGRKKTPGLYKRSGVWHIDKQVRGHRLCESTGEEDLEKAVEHLARRIDQSRQESVYGVRPTRTFRQAATKHLNESGKDSIGRDAQDLKLLDPFIGSMALDRVHSGTVQGFITARKAQGKKSATINRSLAVVRHILNLAAGEWLDEHGITWLAAAPKIKLLSLRDARQPYPLSWEEQRLLFEELPPHLGQMALFKVNTGCREQEVCGLKWEWELPIPELDTVAFLIPSSEVKNREDRLVVLNRVAKSVIDGVRGKHPEYVFTYKGQRVGRIYNSAWKRAREAAAGQYQEALGQACPEGFRKVRVHDLKHTYGRRLRAAGVSFEDRQDLLGHKSGRMTTHYSAAELTNLIKASNKVCENKSRKSPALVVLKKRYAQATPAAA
ncbi:MAG: tyrosine-type recombinase/integrase [Deltaproteobacteria bacterium]|nr:tyrosine-type recombinase/integrase [Deltaproteobacteria bacterium]